MNICMKRTAWILTITTLLIFFSLTGTVKAATPYMIKVNKGTNVVTVYKQDKSGNYTTPVTAFVCSTGLDTPVGTFPLQYKMRWGLLSGPSYGQYCSVITGNFLFHSVWYYEKKNDTQSYVEYNKLGTTASHGCVRLTTIDAKWIYDNCVSGTPIKIFYGSAKHDKLGKPEFISVAGYTGWDPTDPDSNNPFKKDFPTFSGLKDRKIEAFTKFNPREGVTAKSGNGENLTKNIKVSGKVNTKQSGTYLLTYWVKDKYHRPTVEKIKVTVVDKTIPIIKGAKDRMIPFGQEVDFLKGITAKMKNGTNITESITYKSNLDSRVPGKYKVRIKAIGTNGKKSSVVVIFTVLEPAEDELMNWIHGVKDRALTYSNEQLTEDEKILLIHESAMDGVSFEHEKAESFYEDDFQINITKVNENQYDVQYILEDIDGNQLIKTALFTLVHIEEEE